MGFLDCFYKSLEYEKSIKFLYKGYLVTIMRSAPVAASSFLAYEITF